MHFLQLSRYAAAIGFWVMFGVAALAQQTSQSTLPVTVEIFERLSAGKELSLANQTPETTYHQQAFGFTRVPVKYSLNALPLDRPPPFVLRATLQRALSAGTYEIRLRSRGVAQLFVDDKLLAMTKPQKANGDGHDSVPPAARPDRLGIRPLAFPHQEIISTLRLETGVHRFALLAVMGGKGLSPVPGELSVSLGRPGELPRLLGGADAPRLTNADWERFVAQQTSWFRTQDEVARKAVSAATVQQWNARHERVREYFSTRPTLSLPQGMTLRAGREIDQFIGAKLRAALVVPRASVSDPEFLRRVTLDVAGVIPTTEEITRFLADPPATRRQRAIDRLINGPGWADHWVSYWQDVLAENPGILKPDLNNTGPFRWWLHQSLGDNLPFDRLVTELVEMEGSAVQGGPAAFGQATLNDSPMAAKANILSQAFLGQNLACARCHDAPNHPFKQRQLYSLAAMLSGKPIKVPETSTVKLVAGFRQPRIEVSLKSGDLIAPEWPFPELVDPVGITSSLTDPYAPPCYTKVTSRHQAAAWMVSPQNERFAEVIVNRVWQRYMGYGLVDSADDWIAAKSLYPEFLGYLARDFVVNGYDLKRLARQILSSEAYQRQPLPTTAEQQSTVALFTGPARRRITAEQLVDSLFLAAGKHLDTEELNLSPLGDRPQTEFLNMGVPCRAWEFTAVSNERDRPALALPIAQSIVDLLTTFGWRQSRQNPITVREKGPSPMQVLILANGNTGTRVVRLSDSSRFTEICLQNKALPALIDETFLRILSRQPTAPERATLVAYLGPTHAGRIVKGASAQGSPLRSDTRVSWGNHLSSEATLIRMQDERRLRMGEEPTLRLTRAFRERFEDTIWALINSPEFVIVP